MAMTSKTYLFPSSWDGVVAYGSMVKQNYLADCDCYGWANTPAAWRGYLVSLVPANGREGGGRVA